MTRSTIQPGALALVAAFLVAAAAHGRDDARNKQGAAADRTAKSATWSSRSLQPMMTVWVPPTPEQGGSMRASPGLEGYTRLTIRFTPPLDEQGKPVVFDDLLKRWSASDALAKGDVRSYDRERRGWLPRMFAGKSIARLLTVRSTFGRARASTVSTFTSVGYQSDRKVGESWASEFVPAQTLTPLFRIDPDSTIRVEATASAVASYNATIAGTLLDIVRRGAALVAPTGALLTSLNKDRFDQATSFVDQTISNLSGETITEKVASELPANRWGGQELMRIFVWLPIANEITPDAKRAKPHEQLMALGSWSIQSEPPTVSVFSDVPLFTAEGKAAGGRQPDNKVKCADAKPNTPLAAACLAFRNLTPERVLDYAVATDVPLGQVLAGDSGIAAARERLIKQGVGAKGDNNALSDNAIALCNLIASRAYALGFNRFDTSAILWAYTSQSFTDGGAGKVIKNADVCTPLKLAYATGLTPGFFYADQKAAANDANEDLSTLLNTPVGAAETAPSPEADTSVGEARPTPNP